MFILLEIIAGLVIVVSIIFGEVYSRKDKYHNEGPIVGLIIGASVILLIVGFTHAATYCDRWDEQRSVEAFVYSENYKTYKQMIEVNKGNLSHIVDLSPMGVTIQDFISQINGANIVANYKDEPLVIKDMGPWTKYMSVTNGAERVVEELYSRGLLPPNRRLLYFDTEGQLDEIVVKDGKFVKFTTPEKGEGDVLV